MLFKLCLFGYVLSAQEYLPVGQVIINGNKKTKPQVILRESPFNNKDSLLISNLDELSVKFNDNLTKTSLFNFVDVNYTLTTDSVIFKVSVEERWYFWPYPILEQADRNLSSFIHNKDFSKINYGIALDLYNFRGLNGLLKFKIRMGYKEQYSFAYHKNGIGLNRNSSIRFQTDYFRQKSTIYSTIDNKPLYAADDFYNWKSLNLGLSYSYRPTLDYSFSIGSTFKNTSYAYKLLNEAIMDSADAIKTNFLNTFIYFRFDSRNNKVYPIRGLYFDIYAVDNRCLDNDQDSYAMLKLNAQYNFRILNSRLYFRTEPSYSLVKKYKDNPLLFYNKLDFSKDVWIRGYEYYYIIGSQNFKFQNTLCFLLSDFKIHNLPSFLPDEFSKTYSRIYIDVFFDYSWSKKWAEEEAGLNAMTGKSLYSAGLGLSFETYYDRLLQIYCAYVGFYGKTGIFVNYKTPLYKLY